MLQLRKTYYQNFSNFVLFYFILLYSHFILQGILKIMTPTRWILTTLRKARENVCEQSSHEFLNAVKFSQLLSWQHAMPHKILQFGAIFQPRYLRNTTYKWIDFLVFIQFLVCLFYSASPVRFFKFVFARDPYLITIFLFRWRFCVLLLTVSWILSVRFILVNKWILSVRFIREKYNFIFIPSVLTVFCLILVCV